MRPTPTSFPVTQSPSVSRVVDDEIEADLDEVCVTSGLARSAPDCQDPEGPPSSLGGPRTSCPQLETRVAPCTCTGQRVALDHHTPTHGTTGFSSPPFLGLSFLICKMKTLGDEISEAPEGNTKGRYSNSGESRGLGGPRGGLTTTNPKSRKETTANMMEGPSSVPCPQGESE